MTECLWTVMSIGAIIWRMHGDLSARDDALPAAPPTTPAGEHPADADGLFAAFVRHRDVHCPRCDYSLRNALHPTCPECGSRCG